MTLNGLAPAGLEHIETGRSQGRSRGWAYFRHGQVESRYYRHPQAMKAFREALQSVDGDRQEHGDEGHLRPLPPGRGRNPLVPAAFLNILPYAFAVLVLVLINWWETFRKRVGAPAALGLPYMREERA